MERPMLLKCTVTHSETPGMYLVSGTLYDDTSFTLKTESHNVELNDPLTKDAPVVDGWVNVMQLAKQKDLVSISLPSSTIQFGKFVNVKELSLMPLGVTIESFRTSKR